MNHHHHHHHHHHHLYTSGIGQPVMGCRRRLLKLHLITKKQQLQKNVQRCHSRTLQHHLGVVPACRVPSQFIMPFALSLPRACFHSFLYVTVHGVCRQCGVAGVLLLRLADFNNDGYVRLDEYGKAQGIEKRIFDDLLEDAGGWRRS
jgi:hypothetical protein